MFIYFTDKHNSDSDVSSDDEAVKNLKDSDSDDDDMLPVFLWKPPKTLQALGEWETHTKVLLYLKLFSPIYYTENL